MMRESRKVREIRHGELIQEKAASIWGWSTPSGKMRASRRVDLLHSFASLKEARTVLEIGCGTGEFTSRLLKDKGVNKIIAIDISLDLIKKGREKIKGPGVNFVVADAENLPFKEGVADAVIGVSVLHHLEIKAAFKEIMRAVKKGGKIVFSEPNMLNPQIMLTKNIPLIKKAAGDVKDETAFLRWSMIKFLKSLGLTNVNAVPFDFLHPLVPEKFSRPVQSIGLFIEKMPLFRELSGSLLIHAQKE